MDVRMQYHFRPSPKGFFAWRVPRLIQLSQHLPVVEIGLSEIAELDEVYWFGSPDDRPTVRAIVEHARLMTEADLQFPIILSSDGRVMDGMHRVAKAVMTGKKTIRAVRFTVDPEPDFKDVFPDELDYS